MAEPETKNVHSGLDAEVRHGWPAPPRRVLDAGIAVPPVTNPLAFRDRLAAWRPPVLLATARLASAWTCLTPVAGAAWTRRRMPVAEAVVEPESEPAPVVDVRPFTVPVVEIRPPSPAMPQPSMPDNPVRIARERPAAPASIEPPRSAPATITTLARPGIGRPLSSIPVHHAAQHAVIRSPDEPMPVQHALSRQPAIPPAPSRPTTPSPTPVAAASPVPAATPRTGFGRPAPSMPFAARMISERPASTSSLTSGPPFPVVQRSVPPASSSQGAPSLPDAAQAAAIPPRPRSSASSRPCDSAPTVLTAASPRPTSSDTDVAVAVAAVATELARHHGPELARALAPVVERWARPASGRRWSRDDSRLELPR